MHESDKAILTAALEEAAVAYKKLRPMPAILGPDDREILDSVSAAVAKCEIFQAIEGLVIFSGGSGPVLDSYSLASRLLSRGRKIPRGHSRCGRVVDPFDDYVRNDGTF